MDIANITNTVPTGDLLSDLNESQRQAVTATEGPVLILAGAGSGKTKVLTRRIAYLIAEKKVSPFHILAVTFTNKAAGEMAERIEYLIGHSVKRLWIGTFHSIFGRILRLEADKIGYKKNYTIYDTEDSAALIKTAMEHLKISTELYPVNQIRARISSAKNRLITPAQYQQQAESPVDAKAAVIYEEYEKRLKSANAFDFDDLIVKPILLFENHPDVLRFYQNAFRYIHVDEYQDTNHAQYRLIRMLAKDHQNICVVGDDDQSIYGWRNADIANILHFERDYSSIRIFKLEQNYRSTKNILQVASQVVRNNKYRKHKTLWTEKEKGEPVVVIDCDSDKQEARAVVKAITESIHEEKRSFSDFAILYRTNAQSRLIEEQLRTAVIPYVIVGGLRFYERKEIKDVLAYLRLINNPADQVSLERIINFPTRGIGKTTLDKIKNYAERLRQPMYAVLDRIPLTNDLDLSPRTVQLLRDFNLMIAKYRELKDQMLFTEWVRILLEETGIIKLYRQENTIDALNRYENIMEFLNAIHDYTLRFDAEAAQEDILSAFLKEVSLVTDIDEWNDKKNTVTLMTIHSSKGLEFPVVSMVGLEEGLFPLENATEDIKELEEERRLFYVGATRAQKRLRLYFARKRMRYNTLYNATPSRFINEIPEDLIEWQQSVSNEQQSFFNDYRRKQARSKTQFPYTDRPVKKTIREKSNVYDGDDTGAIKTAFRVGQRVEHPSFGSGTIIQTEGRGDKQKLTVQFLNGDEKKLIVKYANLIVR